MKHFITALSLSFIMNLSTSAFAAELAGKIQGAPWTFVSGRAKPSMFRPGFYDFAFWDHMESQPCDSFTWGSDRKIIAGLPAKAGKYTLGNTQNITFNYPQNQNKVATKGTFVISKITEDAVIGTINAKFDNKNFVTGSFSLQLCK